MQARVKWMNEDASWDGLYIGLKRTVKRQGSRFTRVMKDDMQLFSLLIHPCSHSVSFCMQALRCHHIPDEN